MKGTSQDGGSNTDSDRNLSVSNIRLSDTDRLEAFSDGVLAITITLLVVDIVRPDYESGHLLQKLQAQWPNYIAFLASFFYVGIIWLNHRSVFSRVRYCSRSLHLANLLLLLTSALIPFPTAVLSTALQHGSPVDATVAVVLYAAVGCLMCLSWLFLFHILSINPHLLETHVELTFFPQERHRALFGVALYILGGITGWAISPTLALMCFLALPIFYAVTSEGLVETRVTLLGRLAPGRGRREASRPTHSATAPTDAHE
ncbi:MAG: TMEM175 family protein [Methylovirgula sp.]